MPMRDVCGYVFAVDGVQPAHTHAIQFSKFTRVLIVPHYMLGKQGFGRGLWGKNSQNLFPLQKCPFTIRGKIRVLTPPFRQTFFKISILHSFWNPKSGNIHESLFVFNGAETLRLWPRCDKMKSSQLVV